MMQKNEKAMSYRPRECPECKSKRLDGRSNYNTICQDCGFVISRETVSLVSKEKGRTREHVHEPKTYSSKPMEKGLEQEKIIKISEQWKKVKTWSTPEKNLVLALGYITKMVADLKLTGNILENAILVYKRIVEKRLQAGRSMRSVTAVSVFIGCKQCNAAITINDIARVSRVNSRRIYHTYKVIVKRLKFSSKPTVLSNYISEISSRLELSEPTSQMVSKIIGSLAGSTEFLGKTPSGIACASIYLSSVLAGEKKTQREIAEVAHITEATIRSRCRELERKFAYTLYM